jgi:ABC-type transport system involved in multi-copper enzyme maturation permease subunit
VAVTTIILACTNLPREIESRVIYSLVTKPTTRLEVVLGKVVGFASVSFTILLIMGVLSYAYLELRSRAMQRHIAQRLETPGAVSAGSVQTLTYYRDAGLLGAKKLEVADAVDVYSRVPEQSDDRRYFYGNGDGSVWVAFEPRKEQLIPPGGSTVGENGLVVRAMIGYVRKGKTPATSPVDAPPTTAATTGPTSKPYYGPFIMSPEERAAVMRGAHASVNPAVAIEVMDANENHVGNAAPLVAGAQQFELINRDGVSEILAYIEPKVVQALQGRFYIKVTGLAAETEYYTDLRNDPVPIKLFVPAPPAGPVELASAQRPDGKPLGPIFQGRAGNFGQQLKGGDEPPTAIFQFRGASYAIEDGKSPFEMRGGVERSGADDEGPVTTDIPTQVSVVVHNIQSNKLSDEIRVQPESLRTVFFRVDPAVLEGGNFNVRVKTLTSGDVLGLKNDSLVLVAASQPFAWNLFKSLLILWLMTVLITAVAIFSSTFLSWPIAVVLTLVILLGHWGVEQLGDSLAPGIGSQVVTDLGLKEPAKVEAVRATVERLSSFLNLISTVLPDISQYAAVEDIERGVSIPPAKLRAALMVTLGFGLPLVLLAYVFLKNKEVAP